MAISFVQGHLGCPIPHQPAFAKLHNRNGTSPPFVLAHRGARAFAPENTLPSFVVALQQGADVAETDIRLTKDGKLVCFHDRTVNRLAPHDNSILVSSLTLQELRTMLPYTILIEELFSGLPTEVPVNIEIKDNDIEVAHRFAEWIMQTKVEHRVVVVSRFCNVINAFRKASNEQVVTAGCEGEVVTSLLLARVHLLPLVTLAKRLLYGSTAGCHPAVLQVPVASAGITLVDQITMDSFHRVGLAVHAWIVNSEESVQQVTKAGVDGIISDRTDNAVRALNKMGLRKTAKPKFEPLVPLEDLYQPDPDQFVPEIPPETHRCVSSLCHMTKHIFGVAVLLIYGVPICLLAYPLIRIFSSTKVKRA